MAATRVLKQIYNMDDGSTLTLSLKDPKTTLTKGQVDNFAALVTGNEALIRDGSYPLSLKEAYIIATERFELPNS